jgi:hypothetical protein
MRAFLRLLLRLFGLILALALVWFVLVQVIGVSVDIVPKGSLAIGKAKWAQKGSANYRVTLQVYRPLRVFGQYRITVRQGKVVDALFRVAPPTQGADFSGSSVPLDQVHDYTINQIFAYTEAQIAPVPEVRVGICPSTRYTVETDPELGYVKTFFANSCQIGLLCPAISDCLNGFKILDLQLLPE